MGIGNSIALYRSVGFTVSDISQHLRLYEFFIKYIFIIISKITKRGSSNRTYFGISAYNA